MGDARLVDNQKVLIHYGFKNGLFNLKDDSNDVVFDLWDIDVGIEKTEGDPDFMDTFEEFFTIIYYSPIEITDPTAKAEIEKEIPHTKEGAMKLVAMWLKKRAENLTNSENYLKVIEMIKQKSGISDVEIKDYYDRAITAEIVKWGKKYFPNYTEADLRDKVFPKLIGYHKEPGEEKLGEAAEYIVKNYLTKSMSYNEIIINMIKDFKKRENDKTKSNLENLIEAV